MKDFLALLFFKGALLKDPDDILEMQGPNSRAGYRMRFTSVRDIVSVASRPTPAKRSKSRYQA